MKREFVPYEQALELKELGFDEPCLAFYDGKGTQQIYFNSYRNGSGDYEPFKKNERLTWFGAPLYQQAFRWFREKYNFKYSIGITNICVYHIPVSNYHTTFMLQDCESYEDAQLQCIKAFIDHAKQK